MTPEEGAALDRKLEEAGAYKPVVFPPNAKPEVSLREMVEANERVVRSLTPPYLSTTIPVRDKHLYEAAAATLRRVESGEFMRELADAFVEHDDKFTLEERVQNDLRSWNIDLVMSRFKQWALSRLAEPGTDPNTDE